MENADQPLSADAKASEVFTNLRTLLLHRNIDITAPGSTMFYSFREKALLVRAPMPELEVITEVIQNLDAAIALRIFKLDPARLQQRLTTISAQTAAEKAEGALPLKPEKVQQTLRALLTKAGVHSTPPKDVFWNEQDGTLLVRGTPQDLNTVERLVQSLNVAPQQVNLNVKFFDIDDAAAAYLLESLLAQFQIKIATNTASRDVLNSAPRINKLLADYGLHPPENSIGVTFASVLPDSQFREFLPALERGPGVHLIGESAVTTLIGRGTHIEIADLVSVITAPGWTRQTPATSTNLYNVQKVPVGPAIDLTPDLAADGLTIQANLLGTVTDFLGYDDSRAASPTLAQLPLPNFRFRQVSTTAPIRDGDTIMISGLVSEEDVKKIVSKVPVLGDLPDLQSLFRKETTARSKKHLLIFVTPRLIDPAGNPLH